MRWGNNIWKRCDKITTTPRESKHHNQTPRNQTSTREGNIIRQQQHQTATTPDSKNVRQTQEATKEEAKTEVAQKNTRQHQHETEKRKDQFVTASTPGRESQHHSQRPAGRHVDTHTHTHTICSKANRMSQILCARSRPLFLAERPPAAWAPLEPTNLSILSADLSVTLSHFPLIQQRIQKSVKSIRMGVEISFFFLLLNRTEQKFHSFFFLRAHSQCHRVKQ